MYKFTDKENTVFYYLTTEEFTAMANKLSPVDLTAISPGNTYYIYETYHDVSINPQTEGYADTLSQKSTKQYFIATEASMSPTVIDFWNDEINLIVTGVLIAGIIVGLIGWGWALLVIAILILILYNLLKNSLSSFFSELKQELQKILPDWAKKLFKDFPFALVFLIALIIIVIFYLSKTL